MSILVSVLSSGSRGNATFVRTDRVRLLIDCGISRRELARRLASIGEDPDSIDAVLVTHEHNDHASALPVLLKEFSIEAYLTWGTIEAMRAEDFGLNGSAIVPITAGACITVGDVDVSAFSVPHDAKEPVAFSLFHAGIKITQVTDIGHVSDGVAENIRGSDLVVLESNHDLDMLRMGPYPWSLKERLMSRNGHLSNAAVGRFIREQYDGQAQRLVLAHISSKNNYPELALEEALGAMRARGFDSGQLQLATQREATPPIRF